MAISIHWDHVHGDKDGRIRLLEKPDLDPNFKQVRPGSDPDPRIRNYIAQAISNHWDHFLRKIEGRIHIRIRPSKTPDSDHTFRKKTKPEYPYPTQIPVSDPNTRIRNYTAQAKSATIGTIS